MGLSDLTLLNPIPVWWVGAQQPGRYLTPVSTSLTHFSRSVQGDRERERGYISRLFWLVVNNTLVLVGVIEEAIMIINDLLPEAPGLQYKYILINMTIQCFFLAMGELYCSKYLRFLL